MAAWSRRGLLAAAAAAAWTGGPARAALDPFTLGVASGDPDRQGFVIWTRLIGPALAPLDAGPVAVRWEVAADEGFTAVARRGRAVAQASLGHAVHVEVGGLAPGRPYWYRFHALGATSRSGRAATAPVTADRLRLALTSCQHWEQGWFHGYRDMVAQAPDLVVQVGDYIYERSFGDGPLARAFGAPEPTDLEGYRRRHALYKTDPDLQAAHAAAPWMVTWDDHEVSNDYAGLANAGGADPPAFARRRAAAYQAYFEHMPVRPSRWGAAGGPVLYRGVGWGRLASLYMLDGRQHRSPQACPEGGRGGGRYLAACAGMDDPARTMLGPRQEAWLGRNLAAESRAWSILGQQVMFAPLLSARAEGEVIWSDYWDGYPAARRRALAALASPAVRNRVVLSGDIHSFWVNDVPGDGGAKDVRATEIVASCIAGRTLADARFGPAASANPHVRFMDNKHCGYVLMDVEAKKMGVDLRALDDPLAQAGRVSSLARFVVEDGRPGALRA